jgi:hypothetical protein
MNIALLAFVALRGLVVVSRLLLLRSGSLSTIIELAWSVLDIPLGIAVGIMTSLTTLEASISMGQSSGAVPHENSCRGVLAVLREVRTLN